MINIGLIVKKNHKDYWDQSWSEGTPFFSQTMPLKKYELLNRLLHVNVTPAVPRGEHGFDPLHKVRPYLDMLNAVFKKILHSRTKCFNR